MPSAEPAKGADVNAPHRSSARDLALFEFEAENRLLKERLQELIAETSRDRADLDRLRTDLDRAVERKQYREQEVKAHAARIDALKAELDAARTQLRAREQELRSSERARMALLNSASWRVTRPLRSLKSSAGRAFLFAFGPRYARADPAPPSADARPAPAEPAPVEALRNSAPVPPAAASASSSATDPALADPALADDMALIRGSGLFDANFYAAAYADRLAPGEDALAHYCRAGWRLKLDPSPRFVTAGYLAANPAVAKAGDNPLAHYLRRLSARRSPQAWPEPAPRIAVFTAVAGGYDEIAEPQVAAEGVDYFAFTDRDLPEGSLWQRRAFDYFHHDPTRTARFVKTHPHLYFPDHDLSIWVDANLGLHVDPREMVAEQRPDLQFASWHHPLRDDVYGEAAECIRRRKDLEEIVAAQVARYRELSLPEKIGLIETSVIVRKHNDPAVVSAMNLWWKEIDNGSKRDQISLPFVLWRNRLIVDYLAEAGICMRSDHRFSYRRHIGR